MRTQAANHASHARYKSVCAPAQDTARFIRISGSGRVKPEAAAGIVRDYQKFGYALFEFEKCSDLGGDLIGRFAGRLCLGAPFVPPLYLGRNTAHLYDTSGVNVVRASDAGSAVHPVFESRNDLRLHTDGTLQELGVVRTALLLCVTPACRGGETVVFKAVDAFAAISQQHPALAEALLDPRALVRCATLGASQLKCGGPVFALERGAVVSRYSVTENDQWSLDHVPNLKEAYDLLETLAQAPSPYLRRVRLETGQGILLANDKVSHGRTAFLDSASQTRHMLRALFTACPSVELTSDAPHRKEN